MKISRFALNAILIAIAATLAQSHEATAQDAPINLGLYGDLSGGFITQNVTQDSKQKTSFGGEGRLSLNLADFYHLDASAGGVGGKAVGNLRLGFSDPLSSNDTDYTSTSPVLVWNANLNGVDADFLRIKYANPEIGLGIHRLSTPDSLSDSYYPDLLHYAVDLNVSPIGGYQDRDTNENSAASSATLSASARKQIADIQNITLSLQGKLSGEAGGLWSTRGNYESATGEVDLMVHHYDGFGGYLGFQGVAEQVDLDRPSWSATPQHNASSLAGMVVLGVTAY